MSDLMRVKIKYINWPGWQILLTAWRRPNAHRAAKHHFGFAIQRATKRVAMLIRKTIRKRELYEGLAPLTRRIKRGSRGKPVFDGTGRYVNTPLRWTGGMMAAVKPYKRGDFEGFAGIVRSQDERQYWLAYWQMHEWRWPVTRKMRNLFLVLARASKGAGGFWPDTLYGRAAQLFEWVQDWRELDPNRTEILVPKRDFLKPAKDEAEVIVREALVRAAFETVMGKKAAKAFKFVNIVK